MPTSEKCASIPKYFPLANWLLKQTKTTILYHFDWQPQPNVRDTMVPNYFQLFSSVISNAFILILWLLLKFVCVCVCLMQLLGPTQHWKQTKKRKKKKNGTSQSNYNMESWVLASSVTWVLFWISLHNICLFIEIIVQLMAHWINLYEVFYILLFILAFVLFLLQLYITVAKGHLLVLKCWKGSTTHPMAEWTLEVACQQIVDILQKQMNCDNPQLPQMWIQKCIWNPCMPDNLFFKFH